VQLVNKNTLKHAINIEVIVFLAEKGHVTVAFGEQRSVLPDSLLMILFDSNVFDFIHEPEQQERLVSRHAIQNWLLNQAAI
jgi:hypothetical protein